MIIVTLISFILVIIGGLNWACIGFFQFDFVAGIFGSQASLLSRAIYILVGLAAIYLVYAVIRYKGRLTVCEKSNQVKEKLAENKDQNHNYGK